MHKSARASLVLVFGALLLLFAASSLARKKAREDPRRWVRILTLPAREAPDPGAGTVFTLYYAQAVLPVGQATGWSLVQPAPDDDSADPVPQGWVSTTSLSDKKLVVTALPDRRSRKRMADPEEPVLAGRTLRKEVERRLAKLEPDRQKGYEQLDAFLQRPGGRPSTAEVLEFRRQGELPPLPKPDAPRAGP